MKRFLLALGLLLLPALLSAQSLGSPIQVNTQDSGTACANMGTCAIFPAPTTLGFTYGITGTFSGTLTAECLSDPVSGWTSMLVTNVATAAQASTITATGKYNAPTSGCQQVRLRATAWTSGTATVTAVRGYGNLSQAIGTSSAPQFAEVGIGTPALASAGLLVKNPITQIGVRIAPVGNDAHAPMMLFQRSNGTVTGNIDESGNFHTNLAIFVSGGWSTTLNADGSINSVSNAPTGQSDMIDVVGDTTFGIVSQGSTVPSSGVFTGLDQTGNFTFNVANTGRLMFGAGNFAAMDTGLDRTAAGVLAVGNGSAGNATGAIAVNKVTFTGFTFANINAAGNLTANGMMGYCTDCTIANPCASGGSGAFAKRLNGVNVCN